MAAFVRFVFTIMIVGMLVNLMIVLLANTQSQRNQARAYQQNAGRFSQRVADVGGHTRRADIIVESQRMDARNNVLESTLLIRQYQSLGASQSQPLPVVRIVIPGDRLQANGLLLEFIPEERRSGYHMPAEFDRNFVLDYPMLRDTQLVFFGLFCGADESAPPPNSNASDERFTFLPRDRVPELIRLDPLNAQASYYELKLWQTLWSQLPEPPRNTPLPAVTMKSTLRATWTKPAIITVHRAPHTYSAFINGDAISLSEDEPGLPDLLGIMLREGEKLNLPVEE